MGREAMAKEEAERFARIAVAGWIKTNIEDGVLAMGDDLRKVDVPLVGRQMVEIAWQLLRDAGVRACRFCACHETYACVDALGEGCAWVTVDVCSAAPCLAAWEKSKTEEKDAAKKGARRGR